MSFEHIVVQPIQTETPAQEAPVAKTACICGVKFTPGFGSVPGLKVLYNRVRKCVVDPLHPITRPELLAEEFCGSRHCAAFTRAEAETKSLAKPGDKPERVAFYTPNTLRLMADWGERNARKLAERDTLRYQRQQAWEKRQLELAATRPDDRGVVNRILAEAGEKHGYHPKRSKKRLPMAERKLKSRKPKSSALPEGGKKKNKKGKDDQKKGGKGKGKK